MRLFGKKTFGRSSWRGAGHNPKDGNDPGDDDSIGSAISTKDQFDIVIPVKASSSTAHNNINNLSATKSWGASFLMGGLLDGKNGASGASGNPHGHGEDDTTVSSITTSPEWQQAYGPTGGGDNINTNNADGIANGPFGARNNNHKSSSSGWGGDDGRTSWACCCAPVGGGAEDDYDDEGREPPSASLGGRSPALTGSTLAPTAHYRPAQYWGRRGATGADPIVAAATSTPSILAAPETRHDDEEGDEEALDPHPTAAAGTERSLATAPIDNSGGGAAAPAATSPEAPTSTSSEAWCCAGAAATLGLAGLCWSAPHDEGTSTDPKDTAAASSSDAWNARRSHSLFDGLDDDEAHGNSNTKNGHGKDGLKSKIKHLRRAIVPWGSHLRQRSKSFRRSKSRNHNNGAAPSEDAAVVMDPGAPMAILATTDRDDHYYWKGAAAE
jgi:hypothetical protein